MGNMCLAGLIQLKHHGGGKELEGCELPARMAGFTILPFVLTCLACGFLRKELSLFVCTGTSLGCSLVNEMHRMSFFLSGDLL